MKNFLLLLFALISSHYVLTAQSGFHKSLSGYERDEGVASVKVTDDGSCLLFGMVLNYPPPSTALLVKLDPNGKLVWSKTYEESSSLAFYDMHPVSGETEYVLGGIMGLFSSSANFLLVKTDTSGSVIWANAYASSYMTGLTAVTEHPGGGTMAVGDLFSPNTPDGAFVIVVDTSGNLVWSRNFNAGDLLSAYSVNTNAGGKILLGGRVSIALDGKGLLACIDTAGNPLWVKTVFDAGGPKVHVETVLPLAGGDWAVMGQITDSAFLLRIDSLGNLIWGRKYSASAFELALAPDSGFVFAAEEHMFRVDTQGEVLWGRSFTSGLARRFTGAAHDNNQGNLAAGFLISPADSTRDVYLVKVDDTARSNCYEQNLTVTSVPFFPVLDTISLTITNVGSSYPVNLQVTPYGTLTNICVDGLGTRNIVAPKAASIEVYPNPTNGLLHIKSPTSGTVHILDCLGRTILSADVQQNLVHTFDLSAIQPGAYFYRFVSGGVEERGVVILR